jgi:glucosylceramidase
MVAGLRADFPRPWYGERAMKAKWIALLLVAAGVMAAPLRAASKESVAVWLTNEDRSALLAKQPDAARFGDPDPQFATIEVDAAKRFQSMDGFGFALTGGSAQLLMRMDAAHRRAILKELFGTGSGDIGVSYVRVSIGSSDMNDHVFTYDDVADGETDPDLKKFSLAPDRADVIPVLKQILGIAPRIKILASPWSAPSWMKTSGKPKGGSLKPEYYDVYAKYLLRYVQGMRAEGIAIDAITIQNEPLNPKNTPSMVMEAEDQDTFIRQSLGPLFQRARTTTKVILYDHNCDRPDYPLDILKDPDSSRYVDGSGFHLYEGEITAMTQVHDAYPKKNLYFTEQMVVDKPGDTALRAAEPVARLIVGAPRNWSRNVLLWNLAADPQMGPHTNDGGCPVCEGAITIDGNKVQRNLAYYVVAHASKFVRPGSVRIDSTTLDGLANVAFETPDQKMAVIVANTSGSAQTFQIKYQGKAAKMTLKAGSVATYVW